MKDGQSVPWQLGIYSDDHLPGLKDMVESVHNAGGVIVCQIAHCGAFSNQQLTGIQPMGPSVLEGPEGPICREMTQKDIDNVVKAFRDAAIRTKKAGFDGVQIHGAHGFLLSEFLSPFFNKRTDGYGGSIENRAKIVMDVYDSVREAVGDDYPVLVKLNADDLLEGGVVEEDMLRVGEMLAKAGIDAIEISSGTIFSLGLGDFDNSFSKINFDEAYIQDSAKHLKERVDVPVMMVGGIRSYEVAESLVIDGVTDYVSLCRPLIREPGLANRWMSGDTSKAKCVSDNACFGPALEGKGLYCVHNK
jgi:2,4-dienoyl-CoA reductase-like NADH-dependent reductase (Old Yellow Enzyme family)